MLGLESAERILWSYGKVDVGHLQDNQEQLR